ncbi:hypothetical protein [Bacteroides intestinalis]|jgi:hypothetical protein|uniref:SmpA / OmlA family n=1 Tax=Siphoviridae sp. ctXQq5 TaxID=2826368 RepID=A0A8S5N0I8_9CAUD|nr:hypothetical protein [Bacteroides intestinalis]DAD88181.1 MAG TPA: SmpA / OmlA family [Siphoviridae sp. ctXQq5]
MKKVMFLMMLLLGVKAWGQDGYFVSSKSSETIIKTVELTEEQKFVQDNFKKLNVADWYRGMRFMAIYKPDIYDMSLLRGENGAKLSDYYHQIIAVDTIVERTVSCPAGSCIRTYILFNTDTGTPLEYEFIGGIDEMRDANFNHIEGIVPLDDIDIARKLLLGKTLYSMTRLGHIDTDKGLRVIRVNKFAPYKIEEIGIGNAECPVKIVVKGNDGKKCCFLVSMNGINNVPNNFLLGDGYFHNVFSFSNPRVKYKNIPSSTWNLIIGGKVKIGMTKEHCQLSWGNPEKVNVTTGSFGTHEQWVYNGNSYLYFENGKLTAIQN